MKVRGAHTGSGSFFGGLGAAAALIALMATGCAADGDGVGDKSPEPSSPSSAGPSATPDEAAVERWHEAMNEAAVDSPMMPLNAYGAGATPANPPPPFKTTASIKCPTIVNGTNSVTVNGKTRKFEVKLPANTSSKAALLFEWHGWLGNSKDFMNTVVYDPPAAQWKPFDNNAFNIPLITIAPQDENLIPVWGLDWDIVSGAKDFPFFEAMLTCAEQQFKVDTTRVYSLGFSAGAVFTNLLAAQYPKLFAATISISGTWFNDQPEWSEIIVPLIGTTFMKWKWPALNPADGGAVLLTHGGQGDFATVISLENANRKALPFLYANGRDVTECTHEFGHTLEPDLTQAMYFQFMWDHQLGGARPTKLTAGMPTGDKPLFNTRCNFRPVVAPAASGVNNVVNAGFETALSNWECTGNCGFDNTTLAHTGVGNGWVRNNSGWNDVHQIFSVVPNRTYTVTGWIKTSDNNNAGYFGVRSVSGQVVGEQKFGNYPGYTKVSVTVNSGSNTNLVVYAGLWANGDTFFQLDDVSVVQN
jgi:predicted esterase